MVKRLKRAADPSNDKTLIYLVEMEQRWNNNQFLRDSLIISLAFVEQDLVLKDERAVSSVASPFRNVVV